MSYSMNKSLTKILECKFPVKENYLPKFSKLSFSIHWCRCKEFSNFKKFSCDGKNWILNYLKDEKDKLKYFKNFRDEEITWTME